MTSPGPLDPASAILAAAAAEWRIHGSENLEEIDFRRWPRGFHRSAWVIAGYIGWNPFDALDTATPAARAVNALVTRRCLVLAAGVVHLMPDPRDPAEPLLAWFNTAVREHQFDIARDVEDRGDAAWNLPRCRRRAARKLIGMWEREGAATFGDFAAFPVRGHAGQRLG